MGLNIFGSKNSFFEVFFGSVLNVDCFLFVLSLVFFIMNKWLYLIDFVCFWWLGIL